MSVANKKVVKIDFNMEKSPTKDDNASSNDSAGENQMMMDGGDSESA